MLSFLATSSDSLFLMLALAAQAEGAALVMRTAYLMAANIILLLALALAQLGSLVSPVMLGYLGLVPICLGLAGLYRWWRRGDEAAPVASGAVSLGAYVLLFLSISADNLVVMTSLLADSNSYAQLVIFLVYGLAAVCLALLIGVMQKHLVLLSMVRRFAPVVVPLGLVAVGGYILLDTVADRL